MHPVPCGVGDRPAGGHAEVDHWAHALIIGIAHARRDLFSPGVGRLATRFANDMGGVLKNILLIVPEIGRG